MDFADRVENFTTRVKNRSDQIATEEAAKSALVMPFLQTLGYDVFDPCVVIPEFTADVADKRGEKVDYAIIKDGQPIMLIECKALGDALDKKATAQLERYFQCTDARVGVLTDGVRYKFFSNLDRVERMDQRPFMDIDFNQFDKNLLEDLRKLTNDKFDVDTALSAAQNLKYTREIKKIFAAELEDPTDNFIRHFASQVYSGHLRANVIESFKERVVTAIEGHITDVINGRLQSAMVGGNKSATLPKEVTTQVVEPETASTENNDDGIVTTQEEIDGFLIVKAILSQVIAPERIIMRDKKSYCGVLLDDNNRKPLCRLHFNTAQKYLGLLDDEKNETRHAIEKLDDLFKFADQLRERAISYDA